MLVIVRYQDWSGDFSFAPPIVDAVVNLDKILSVVPTVADRGSGPFVKVTLEDKQTMICEGTVANFFRPVDLTGKSSDGR